MRITVEQIEISRETEQTLNRSIAGPAHVLVKLHGKPLGWIRIPGSRSEKASPSLLDRIKSQFGYFLIRKHLLQTFYAEPEPDQALPISVVVCTRNRTQQLEHCLNALLKLNYDRFEVIIVDNAPSDNSTRELAASYPFRYVREDTPGLDNARNRGITEAANGIIAFTDDDAEPGECWLQNISRNFADETVMCVTGFVAPAELETAAQQIFEFGYGGMGHGFSRRVVNRKKLSDRQLLWASSFGIGANMAFRKPVFDQVGMFDPGLDVGTPSCGAGDVEMFFRIVHTGHTLVYDPAVLVSHNHRSDMRGLTRQIENNGRSFGCYLITCVRNGRVRSSTVLRFLLVQWFFRWNLRNLIKGGRYLPRTLAWAELRGMIMSPFAYSRSRKHEKAIRQTQQKIITPNVSVN